MHRVRTLLKFVSDNRGPIIGFALLIALLIACSEIFEKFIKPMLLQYSFFRTIGTILGVFGFALWIFRWLPSSSDSQTSLDYLRKVSLLFLFYFGLWVIVMTWAAFRPEDKFAPLQWVEKIDPSEPEWAYTARLKVSLTFGLLGGGGIMYCLKRRSKAGYGVIEIVFALAANWTLSDKILKKVSEHNLMAEDLIGVAGAFYVFTRGVGNVMEGSEEALKNPK